MYAEDGAFLSQSSNACIIRIFPTILPVRRPSPSPCVDESCARLAAIRACAALPLLSRAPDLPFWGFSARADVHARLRSGPLVARQGARCGPSVRRRRFSRVVPMRPPPLPARRPAGPGPSQRSRCRRATRTSASGGALRPGTDLKTDSLQCLPARTLRQGPPRTGRGCRRGNSTAKHRPCVVAAGAARLFSPPTPCLWARPGFRSAPWCKVKPGAIPTTNNQPI